MDPEPEDLAEFFRTRRIGFCRCLEPTMQCGEPAIRAHSIQNRQTIALLEQDNHVLAWQPRKSDPSERAKRGRDITTVLRELTVFFLAPLGCTRPSKLGMWGVEEAVLEGSSVSTCPIDTDGRRPSSWAK